MKKILLLTILLLNIQTECYKNFILIAAPGSGKGTFSQHMIQKHNLRQICPGDLFRSEIRRQTDLGKQIQPIVEKGEYVDEEIVCQLIATHLCTCIEQNTSFIIDGFPRSTQSYDFLHAYLTEKNLLKDTCFIQFIAPDETCIQRITGRQICTDCSQVYNVFTARSKIENICNNCGNHLSLRSADSANIATKRLQYFHEHVEPLINLAKQSYDVITIQANAPIDELIKKYDQLIS